MQVDKLLNEANKAMAEWFASLSESNRNGLMACCAKGDLIKLELLLNPAPYDRDISIAVTITDGDTGKRATISEAFVIGQVSH